MTGPKRTLWIQLALATLGLLGLILFRGPLESWFSLDWDKDHGSPRGRWGHGDGPGEGFLPTPADAVPAHAFESNELDRLGQVFSAYEEIRLTLAQDGSSSLPAAAARFHSALEPLLVEGTAAYPAVLRDALEEADRSARVIAGVGTVAEARAPFGGLSRALFQLARADPRLQDGWSVFRCPLAEGFAKWFQASGSIENPYMGQSMLSCGASSQWEPAVEAPALALDAEPVAHWTCSMHPSIRQQDSGTCPICNMDLTAVTLAELRTGEVRVGPVRRQRIGVRTQVVQVRRLIRPIRAVGRVSWDESRLHDVTVRVDGWVEDLHVSRTGDRVERGAPLLAFYSPELLATQRELLAAPENGRLAEIARERLRLWGMSTSGIGEMLREGTPRERVSLPSPISGVVVDKRVHAGARLNAGALLYRIVDPSRVWVEADVFEQDLPHVALGQPVRVELPHVLDRWRDAEVAYVYPSLDPDSRTGRVRVELDNPEGILKPGMFANLTFDVDLGERLAVASEAILYTGPRRLVMVDLGEGRLRPVEVRVGPSAGPWVSIEEGLEAGDVVVSSGAFLVAAESRIRSAATYWGNHDEEQ